MKHNSGNYLLVSYIFTITTLSLVSSVYLSIIKDTLIIKKEELKSGNFIFIFYILNRIPCNCSFSWY